MRRRACQICHTVTGIPVATNIQNITCQAHQTNWSGGSTGNGPMNRIATQPPVNATPIMTVTTVRSGS